MRQLSPLALRRRFRLTANDRQRIACHFIIDSSLRPNHGGGNPV
ncbi:hypothetical protein [Polaromonas jejuensis]|uniref:Transposase n=1 Tax=Polaromonas jejuensis TaxID=457502 RepID=A0ABW0QG54_9BURK|nr:hypothetical protein [Polaromonas jejuensis]